MKVMRTVLDDVLLFEPKVFDDDRGFFFESFNQEAFDAAVGTPTTFVQDNHSRSAKGVLRGLHLQTPPHAQGKLVRVTSGRVFDVAVDVRPASAMFRRWVGIELSAESRQQVWIPPGFAHGFLVMSDGADFLYKTTDYYAPSVELGIRWNDPELAIAWPDIGMPFVLSDKDARAPLLAESLSTRKGKI